MDHHHDSISFHKCNHLQLSLSRPLYLLLRLYDRSSLRNLPIKQQGQLAALLVQTEEKGTLKWRREVKNKNILLL